MSGMDSLTEADREQITNAAYEAHRNWCRGARGQMISEWDSIESWIAVETAAFLAHRRASQAAPAPSDGLREEANAVLAGLGPVHGRLMSEGYEGSANAVMNAAEWIRAALTPAPAQEGGE